MTVCNRLQLLGTQEPHLWLLSLGKSLLPNFCGPHCGFSDDHGYLGADSQVPEFAHVVSMCGQISRCNFPVLSRLTYGSWVWAGHLASLCVLCASVGSMLISGSWGQILGPCRTQTWSVIKFCIIFVFPL